MLDPEMPAEYLVAHIGEALVRDARVSEQGLDISIHSHPFTVTVAGVVASASGRERITEVISELLPDAGVRNETEVAAAAEDPDQEHIA